MPVSIVKLAAFVRLLIGIIRDAATQTGAWWQRTTLGLQHEYASITDHSYDGWSDNDQLHAIFMMVL